MKARRRFAPAQYESVLARQNMICACGCGETLVVGLIDWDHRVPLSMGGKDEIENIDGLIRKHHRKKSAKETTIRAKCDRVRAKFTGKRLNARDREIQRIVERKEQRA